MRFACCLALAALGFSAASAAAAEPRALFVVLPVEDERDGLEFFHGGMSVAVASPAVSGDALDQAFLDVSQGARVSARVYDDDVPWLRLAEGGRIEGWAAAAARAEDAPGDLVPGLLGETVRRSGGRTAYVGTRARAHRAAAVAADAGGRIDAVSLGPTASLWSRADRALRDHSLVVVEFPPGPAVTLFPHREDLLVIAVGVPPATATALLPTGALFGAPPTNGLLESRTTRRPGMVALTDYAPTILEELGIEVPDEMQGRRLEQTPGPWEHARSLSDRVAHIKSRRGPALRLSFGLWLAALGALAVAGRARTGLRLLLLAAMWLPGVALLTGGIDPARWVESVTLAAAPLALAAATDRLVAWPRSPTAPAVAVLGAHAVDLVAGSPLIVRSLAGPNPAFGARFYGIGNELEAILSAMVLIGAGALLAGRRGRAVPAGFAAVCAVAALFMGAGRLGADVGGVITLAAGGAAAVLASLPGGVTRRAVALAVAAPVAALAALVAVDLVTGGDAHLTRSVLDADSPRELLDVVERRFDISWSSLKQGTTPLSVGLFAALLAYGVARRRRVLAPLGGERAFAAGMWGALGATVVGALANDSGPTIFLVGASALVLAAGYLAGKPLARRLP